MRAIASAALSPVDVTRAVLARIEACEPQLHATYALDADAALTMAHASEQRWAKGAPQGLLDGVPVTLKENIATRGVPSPMGSAATELRPAAQDAPPAARLRETGAVFVAKTTMPDFGMLASALSSFHALTRNPWDLGRNTGGSSSGAGAAAAAGYGPLHVGTDIGGSIRIPANFCGVFGLKPSLGRVPIDPPFPGRVAGPMTRTVADAALMMRVLSQPDGRDHMSLPAQDIEWDRIDDGLSLRGLRIGLWLDPGFDTPVDEEVRAAVTAAASAFERAGAIVQPVAPWVAPEMLNALGDFSRMRVRMDTATMPAANRLRMLPVLREAASRSEGMTAERLFAALTQMTAMRATTVAATRGYDYVLSPVSAHLPFAAEAACAHEASGDITKDVLFTCPFNVSEQPGASINCGYSRRGLPIGLQIVGRRFDDLGVLRVARSWELMRGQQRDWPKLKA